MCAPIYSISCTLPLHAYPNETPMVFAVDSIQGLENGMNSFSSTNCTKSADFSPASTAISQILHAAALREPTTALSGTSQPRRNAKISIRRFLGGLPPAISAGIWH